MKNLIPLAIRYRIMEWRARSLYSGYPDQHHCVFIHIPKTAGTSVVNSLFGQGSRHVRYTEYQRANPRKFTKYFKFCFIRNPWDRLLSAYLFLKQGGMNDADRTWSTENIAPFETFTDFVHQWVNEDSIWDWVHFLPQHHWICDSKMHCHMDFVGKMESIGKDFNQVAEHLGLTAKLLTNNRTRTEHYSMYYTDAMRDIVAKAYANDIDVFGYQFEDRR